MKNRYIEDVNTEIATIKRDIEIVKLKARDQVDELQSKVDTLEYLARKWQETTPPTKPRESPVLAEREAILVSAFVPGGTATAKELMALCELSQKQISTTLQRSAKFDKAEGNRWKLVEA